MMKKWFLTLLVSLVLFCGGSVQATQSVEADAIIEKCGQVMSQKNVVGMSVYMVYEGERMQFMNVISDMNTQISYVEMMGIQMYTDNKAQIMYMYDAESNCWYVSTMTDDSEAGGNTVIVDDTTDMTEMITNYTYEGVKTYQGVECETIAATVKVDETQTQNMTIYINAATYELYAITAIDEGTTEEIIFTYPERLTIPKEVIQNATISPNTIFTDKKISYIAVKSGNKTVLKVTDGEKVTASNVTIPDTVTYAGKKYAVVEISDNAFQKNNKIKTVTIGKNVKKIGSKAFFDCKKLTRVTIKSSQITKIGSKAFYGNAKKLTIKVPKSKVSKYKKLLKNSKISSKYTVSKN